MNENKDVLEEINKGCIIGMNSIKEIASKAEDKQFKEVLENEYSKYEIIHKRIEDNYNKYSDKELPENSVLNKAMTWSMINMKTIMDDSTSKLADLLVQGTNMGIIEGRRILNHKKNIDKEVEDLVDEFVKMQEESVETLKKYL